MNFNSRLFVRGHRASIYIQRLRTVGQTGGCRVLLLSVLGAAAVAGGREGGVTVTAAWRCISGGWQWLVIAVISTGEERREPVSPPSLLPPQPGHKLDTITRPHLHSGIPAAAAGFVTAK